ncbi:ribonuclease P protein component [Rhodoferax koreense]|uniref:Ribonuclease P protein component n=1 Tax=Rhodoferax koreensis TaxID=1842727 RepID=A0A1P8K354_9BURK|nr:ribonuclease P protein component [Rhodoferax koreense]APW40361.1 ribonuclease P protein component [Rhodoferax koreense]
MQRLKTRAQFQAVMGGKTVSRTAHFVLHRLNLPVPSQPSASATAASAATGPESTRPQALFAVDGVWIGALVPKRWAKRAVTRNAIKRQIYTVSQAFEPRWPEAAHVVRLRSGFDRKQFISATSEALKLAVRTELLQLFERAEVAPLPVAAA